jgi:hypothetical protein
VDIIILAFTWRDRGKPWRTSRYPVLRPRFELWTSLRGSNFAGHFFTMFGSRPLQWFSPNSELVIDMYAYACVYIWHILNLSGRQACVNCIHQLNKFIPHSVILCSLCCSVGGCWYPRNVCWRSYWKWYWYHGYHNTEQNYKLPTLCRVRVCSGHSVTYSSKGFSNYDTANWPRVVRCVRRIQTVPCN